METIVRLKFQMLLLEGNDDNYTQVVLHLFYNYHPLTPSPGHSLVAQGSSSASGPSQLLPPYRGAGAAHQRCRRRTPLPQVALKEKEEEED